MPRLTHNGDENTIGGWTTSSTHTRDYKTVNLISSKSQNGLEQTLWNTQHSSNWRCNTNSNRSTKKHKQSRRVISPPPKSSLKVEIFLSNCGIKHSTKRIVSISSLDYKITFLACAYFSPQKRDWTKIESLYTNHQQDSLLRYWVAF